MRLQTLLFLTSLCGIQLSQGQTPCLDPYACNFNTPEECVYTDLDGLPCVVGGCTNSLACNYTTNADIDDGSCEFTSCIGCTNPLACNFDSLAVYDDGACITFIDCNGTCGGTWIQNECGICYDPSVESNQDSIVELGFSGAPVEVQVPLSAITASLIVRGAQGGNYGGHGAILETTEFPVIPGSMMLCYVGGSGNVIQSTGGGGGASCVSWQNQTGMDFYVIAGGGGGRDFQGSDYSLMDASLTTSGHAGEQGGPGGEMGADGGSTYLYGEISGGGGGGFISANQGDYYGTTAAGTTGSFGFGGGGGGTGNGIGNSGGGGGGYSGGGGGGINKDGGGGGSFSDVALANSQVSNSGNGTIQLTFHLTIIPDCIPGCTSELACNYDATATFDNGTCDHCFCGEGTSWDSTLQQCVSIAPPCAPSCGNGTVWDPINEECIIAIPADLNYDGCVSVSDLLELLTVHGTCPPYPEWPDEPSVPAWSCGDSLQYWDYLYETVQIGSQCWFAENLQTSNYSDGSVIPTAWDGQAWDGPTFSNATEGMLTNVTYNSYLQNLCGPLYNWHSCIDSRGLCPEGWSVPEWEDWIELTDTVAYLTTGNANSSSNVGYHLKEQTVLWGGDGGADTFGMSLLPCGWANSTGIISQSPGSVGFWWSTDEFGTGGAVGRTVQENHFWNHTYSDQNDGFSVRCIKD